MKLTHFEISGDILICGLGSVWDMHSCADLDGIKLLPEAGSLILEATRPTQS